MNDVSRCFCFALFSILADVCVEACDRFGQGGPLIKSLVGRSQNFLKKN